MNPRKDMVLYNLWLTKDEERVIKECLGSIPSISWLIIKKAFKRGDFYANSKKLKGGKNANNNS